MPIETQATAQKRRWRNSPSALALATCCVLLVACQHTEPLAPPPAVVEAPEPATAEAATPTAKPVPVQDAVPVQSAEAELASVLRYAERLRGMSAAERKQELNTQGSQVPRSGAGPTPGTSPSPKAQMQLALALLQTREPVETARALGLLQRVAASTEPQARAYTALAHVLIDNLTTTRRLEDNLERASQQLRESQRRNDALNERLDAMRAIERSLNESPANAPRTARP